MAVSPDGLISTIRAQKPGAVARLLWYLAAAGGVAAVTVLMGLVEDRLPPTRLQMTYLLLVLSLAIGGGRGPAIFASVLAFLTFDWFFVKPVGNLFVNDPMEWFALGLFLVVGISTGTLAAGLKRSAAEARRRGRETAILYDLSMAILWDTSLERMLSTVAERVSAALDLKAVTILLAAADGRLSLVARAGPAGTAGWDPLLADDQRAAAVFRSLAERGAAHEAEAPPVSSLVGEAGGERIQATYLPLWLNGRPLGLLAAYGEPQRSLSLSQESARLLSAFAVQTSLAVGRVRLEEEEERAHAAAESERLKSSFLASISHDLRTPLTAIRTAAALLDASWERPARAEAKENLDQEVDRLNHLVGNLLEMSRIESGSAPLHLLLEDLTEVLGATANRFAALMNGRQLRLRAPADLPPIPLDAAQFDRVLSNLLENAIKFSPPETVISVEVTVEAGAALIRVHNAGAPIPADQQLRIFDKFQRMDGAAQSVGGSGLGLAICRSIVEAHEGRIWTSNEDGGVAFYVSLPIPAPADAAELPVELAAI